MRVCGVQKCLASAGEHTPPKAASRRSTQRKCKNTWCRGRTWGLALAPTPGKGGGMERETFREPQTTGHDSCRVSVMGTPGWMSGPCKHKCPLLVNRTDPHRTIRPSFAKDACAIRTDVDESRGCMLGKRLLLTRTQRQHGKRCYSLSSNHSVRPGPGARCRPNSRRQPRKNWSRPRHVPSHT